MTDCGIDTTMTTPDEFGLNGSRGKPLWFNILAGGHPVGPYAEISAQEKITQMRFGFPLPADPEPDDVWKPVGGDARFYIDRSTFSSLYIFDHKSFSNPEPHWPNFYTAATYNQYNRITWRDSIGVLKGSELGGYQFKIVRTGPDTFQTQIR